MAWQNPLQKRVLLDLPLVEVTPVTWHGRLVLAECWREAWKGAPTAPPCTQIRDVESGDILGHAFEGYTYTSAFVWNGTFYLFGAQLLGEGDQSTPHDVWMVSSSDLRKWTKPIKIVEAIAGELCFNQSVCHDGNRFVMAYETDSCTPFTIKFAESADLVKWRKIPDAIFAPDRYAACPAIRFAGSYYYMLYLERPSEAWWFETWVARTRDLCDWELSPRNPVIAPDPSRGLHPDYRYARADVPQHEINASDPDLVEYKGTTRVYFTGGNQWWGGWLQYEEFAGPMQQLFERYFGQDPSRNE